jgi:hypothetical protein
MKTLIISGATLGRGDDALGTILMEKFLTLLAQGEAPPQTVFFYNTGVLLTKEDSPVLPYLQALGQRGARLLACGTCLDYFKMRPAPGIEAGTMGMLLDLMGQGGVVTV